MSPDVFLNLSSMLVQFNFSDVAAEQRVRGSVVGVEILGAVG
jgi:hypothetical protein